MLRRCWQIWWIFSPNNSKQHISPSHHLTISPPHHLNTSPSHHLTITLS
ncbi:MAG: hypothetical protein MSA69_04490 [Prevotella sp.]|nr:hypothetical protein [Prevotella sp.]